LRYSQCWWFINNPRYQNENLDRIQLHQQIKAIDHSVNILFVTTLNIIDELLSIVPWISKEEIMRKPVDKKEFTNTVKKLLN
jgi:hypothetical protein